ncbi:MAG: outer membrane beta-barrel protein, partial [Kiritimatiellaeota bacterium]|nr:outer membrane beta-barrel protein [Kiritimatiellota bacterium]
TFGNSDTDNKLGYGIQASYQFKQLRMELAYSRLEIADNGDESEGDSEGDVVMLNHDVAAKINAFTLSGWWCIPLQKPFNLYAGGGIGYYMPSMTKADVTFAQTDPEIAYVWGRYAAASFDMKNGFGFHLGGGAEYSITENICIFAELRYVMVKLGKEATVYLLDASTTRSLGDFDWNHFMARLGANYKF